MSTTPRAEMISNVRVACRNAMAATAVSMLLLAGTSARAAANFPTRPIRMVVGLEVAPSV